MKLSIPFSSIFDILPGACAPLLLNLKENVYKPCLKKEKN